MTKTDRMLCIYCGAPIAKNDLEMDHFPIPERHGGKLTVPACRTCHTMKDRFSLESISVYLMQAAVWGGWNRETRILFAKMANILLDLEDLTDDRN
jgi:hypothetical protein